MKLKNMKKKNKLKVELLDKLLYDADCFTSTIKMFKKDINNFFDWETHLVIERVVSLIKHLKHTHGLLMSLKEIEDEKKK